jgi:hypothetical protein
MERRKENKAQSHDPSLHIAINKDDRTSFGMKKKTIR